MPAERKNRGIEGISQFVLEVRAGFATAHRVGPGTPVEFIGVALDKEAPPE